MGRQWIIPAVSPDAAVAARRWGVEPVVAQLLLNRGVLPDQPCKAFLSPVLNDLHPPSLLPGTVKAAEMIVDAVRSRAPIVLYGDYDVDGTTGVAILWHVCRPPVPM